MNIQRGFRDKIEKYANPNRELSIEMNVNGSGVYDYCCFGVDAAGKLSDDRYMVFYNQTRSPKKEITFSSNGSGAKFDVNLSKLPSNINRLVFTVSIDGNGTMGNIISHTLNIIQNRQIVADMALTGGDFHTEKAIIAIEIYKKDVWRFAAVASGFNGGLGDLLRAYGGEEKKSPAPIPQAAPEPIPQKKEKISLKKGEKVSLSKNNGTPIIVENGWTASGKDYDLKALVRYRNGKQIYIGAANDDELLRTPDGAVCHGGDIKAPGELEHIEIKWHPDIASVAVSSYSAIENGLGSFNKYGVFVRIRNGNQTIEIPAANTSANDRSYTLCFGEIIFGSEKDSLVVSALEMYSAPSSEHRIGYKNGVVCMDIGPVGRTKR
jgi:tellurium resistance protein TerD